jgi:hypothetical protein
MSRPISRIRFHPLAVLGIASLIAGAGTLLAHHGWSSYDASKTLELEGTIRESSYESPHGMLRLETEARTWKVILAPPSRMERRGLTREMLSAGKSGRVVGYPHREKADEMRAERITIEGKTFELR